MAAGLPAYFGFRTKLRSIGDDAREAREQVKNSHDTNLREEGDERHGATMGALREVSRDVRGLRADHQATRKDLGLLWAEDRAGRAETQELRTDFQQHVAETAPILPVVKDLHDRYVKET